MVGRACVLFILLSWLSFLQVMEAIEKCDRNPSEYSAPKSRSPAGKFRLRINGNPENYKPNTNYTVFIEAEPKGYETQRFTEFNLIVESLGNGFDAGKFELGDSAQTKFSENCRNMIKQTTKSYKERVFVYWTAPPPDNGCVTFKTTILVRRDTWYQDDEPLSIILCEDHQETIQPKILPWCTACSEATYEVTFEGLWSRHTHPNNFPQDLFQTRFSKIIGAAHNKYYSLWEYNQTASDGFRAVAENGDITALEAELKQQGSNIRTIIRAPGIGHPDETKKTFATFRTTPEHHLMSLVSMIVPSPDWIVGVSKLELCLENGSWVNGRTLNLYPWDAGTDSGVTYESPNEPTEPRDIIRQIRTDDPSSPFYDKDGEPMKPLARLHVVRLNLFEKNCGDRTNEGYSSDPYMPDEDGDDDDDDDDDDDLCKVTEWSDWTECSKQSCGYRSRQREYINQFLKGDECNKTLTYFEECEVENNNCWDSRKCSVTQWGDWSNCYKDLPSTCKSRVRYRQITGPEECKTAQNKPSVEESRRCEGNMEGCEKESNNIDLDQITQEDTPVPNCMWDLSECNVTCGQGYKELKLVKRIPDGERIEEEDFCETYPVKPVPCDTGVRCDEGGFQTIDNISSSLIGPSPGPNEVSPNPIIDCVVSRWSPWTPCSATCGNKARKSRERHIMKHAQNGGRPCPKKLYKNKRCDVPPCDSDKVSQNSVRNGCVYGPWTSWSDCTVTCGEGKKQKTRTVITKSHQELQCDNRIKTKPCILPTCRQH